MYKNNILMCGEINIDVRRADDEKQHNILGKDDIKKCIIGGTRFNSLFSDF